MNDSDEFKKKREKENSLNPQEAIKIPEKFRKPYRFKCQNCGHCCSDPDTIVNLTYSDIIRLHETKHYSLDQLLNKLSFYVFSQDPTPEQIKQMVFPPIHTQKGPAFIGLRKRDDGRCVFLNKQNKCSIYRARPNLCRTFPFHYYYNNIDSSGKSQMEMNWTVKAIDYCEGIGDPNPEINMEEWSLLGRFTLENLEKEKVLIQQWNDAVNAGKISGTAENYLRIVLNLIDKEKYPAEKKSEKKNYKNRVKSKLEKNNTFTDE
ncbi:MAG: YkgJ family cysteine cluster protein [Promethearchaeota archaeon]